MFQKCNVQRMIFYHALRRFIYPSISSSTSFFWPHYCYYRFSSTPAFILYSSRHFLATWILTTIWLPNRKTAAQAFKLAPICSTQKFSPSRNKFRLPIIREANSWFVVVVLLFCPCSFSTFTSPLFTYPTLQWRTQFALSPQPNSTQLNKLEKPNEIDVPIIAHRRWWMAVCVVENRWIGKPMGLCYGSTQ